jgi:hypothetical protein
MHTGRLNLQSKEFERVSCFFKILTAFGDMMLGLFSVRFQDLIDVVEEYFTHRYIASVRNRPQCTCVLRLSETND